MRTERPRCKDFDAVLEDCLLEKRTQKARSKPGLPERHESQAALRQKRQLTSTTQKLKNQNEMSYSGKVRIRCPLFLQSVHCIELTPHPPILPFSNELGLIAPNPSSSVKGKMGKSLAGEAA